MKQIFVSFVLCGAAACASEPPSTSPAVADVVSYQGNSYLGVGTHDGALYAGVSIQGATYAGAALSSVSVDGTALVGWTQRADQVWEQRFPDRLCLWNAARTVRTSCTSVNLATAPSPLAGATLQAQYVQNGTTTSVTIEIGTSTSQLAAVQADTAPGAAPALFALNGSTAAATRIDGTPGAACSLIPQGQRVGGGPICSAPGGCRANCDVWLYDVRVPDASGQAPALCPPGEQAVALAGTWNTHGAFAASSTQFTFACTGGTVAKCTRWGYRPWDSAYRSNGTPGALASYHQACARAAAADYCGDGTSRTRPATLVDVYDFYPAGGSAAGFIERTRDGIVARNLATALVWESTFDQRSAAKIDHTRFLGIHSPPTMSLECWQQYPLTLEVSDGTLADTVWFRSGQIDPEQVMIDSTPVCAHSELMTGSWMHVGCSTCTTVVHDYHRIFLIDRTTGAVTVSYPNEYCVLPSGHWDANCAQIAQTQCSASQRMASHSECSLGAGIGKYASGCALKVELDIAHEYCATTWDASCVTAANARCTGGLEAPGPMDRPGIGFCGQPIVGGNGT